MNIGINGLHFVQTHDSDPIRFDVRNADFVRVGYVECNNGKLTCMAKGGKLLYETNVNSTNPEHWFGYCADSINEYLSGITEEKLGTARVKMWRITGYKGFDNYDGPSDNNMCFEVLMDARFKKEEVEEIFLNRFSKKHRTVALSATEIATYGLAEVK